MEIISYSRRDRYNHGVFLFLSPLSDDSSVTPLADVIDGETTPDGVAVGSILEFRCNPGFKLIGDRTLVCGLSGGWNAIQPYCSGLCVTAQYNQ